MLLISFLVMIPIINKPTCVTTGAVTWRCSIKKVILEISQNSQENVCARFSFLIKLSSCKFCEISNNKFSYRTPPAASSVTKKTATDQ